MSTVNIKYLKDESGNIISPITSIKSIYNGDVSLEDFMSGNVLWVTSNNSTVSSITISDSRKNYKRLVMYYKDYVMGVQKSVTIDPKLTNSFYCDGMVWNGQINSWNYSTIYQFNSDTQINKLYAVNLSRDYSTGNFLGQTTDADIVIPIKIVGYKY